jgi:hypothetical protein
MKFPVHELIAGTTIKVTWANTEAIPTPISSAIRDRSEVIVSSTAAVASGNGLYYALHTMPNSSGWYVNEWIATLGVNTYVNRQFIRAYKGDVD